MFPLYLQIHFNICCCFFPEGTTYHPPGFISLLTVGFCFVNHPALQMVCALTRVLLLMPAHCLIHIAFSVETHKPVIYRLTMRDSSEQEHLRLAPPENVGVVYMELKLSPCEDHSWWWDISPSLGTTVVGGIYKWMLNFQCYGMNLQARGIPAQCEVDEVNREN